MKRSVIHRVGWLNIVEHKTYFQNYQEIIFKSDKYGINHRGQLERKNYSAHCILFVRFLGFHILEILYFLFLKSLQCDYDTDQNKKTHQLQSHLHSAF